MRRLIALAAFATLALAPAAFAKGRLDPSFGEGGVVDVAPALESLATFGAAAASDDGPVYFTQVPRQATGCGAGGCAHALELSRYRSNGTLDSGFGGGTVEVTTGLGSERPALLAVDGAGRPIVTWTQPGDERKNAYIRRYRRDGTPDTSFGATGVLHLGCGCIVGSITPLPGGKLLVGGHTERRPAVGRERRLFFTRLLASGRPDPRFGSHGRVWLEIPNYLPPEVVVPISGGATMLGGFRKQTGPRAPYVLRLSGNGRLDRLYARRTRRALTHVYETGEKAIGWERISLVTNSRGGVDVYGDSYERGVLVRLLPGGGRDRSLGKDGERLPREVEDATTDGAGGALVVGHQRGKTPYVVFHVSPDGRRDKKFGQVPLPGAYDEEGPTIFPVGSGKAVVLSRGEFPCRFYCPPQPKLYRLIDG